MDVHLIPGLGADHRLFGRIDLPGHRVIAHDWPTMPAGSTLADLAARLAERVDRTVPHALVGVSMGGMVAQELAALTGPQRVVIISSWKGPHEMPAPIKVLRGTHPEKLLSRAFIQRTKPFLRWQMGATDADAIALLDALLEVHPVAQLQVQVDAVLRWNGPARPVPGLVHVHGDNDHLMPLGPIRGAVVVKGGGHLMVYTLAPTVSALVQRALAGEPLSSGPA
ncbi:MAG: alpha/beta fold hydrolase [Flavobacteriales bacterium]|nr:alpha/beta fold hydrolase [Flavobacteriales bacterium]MBK7941939.1 alpha/beta fold hydrolase [Flavobacteriales bacterium]MBK9700482.1 alpha/beta fold hydrolase [Flavobacteriales bacterium]